MSGTAQVNGPQGQERYLDGVDPEDPEYIKNLQRPAEVKEDIHQMENRSRVKVVLNSECFKEDLEQIVDEQIRNGPYPASLLHQINELLMPASRGGLNNLARASTVIPINDLKGTDNTGFVKGEKLLRCKVAALYRLVDLHGWSQGIYNHISARVSSDDEHFLLNPFGMHYPEVTASSLVKVDVSGEIVDPGTSHFGVSKAGFTLHSAIHQARPDIKCIIHLHTPNGIAVSAMKCGLLPLCQEAIFCGNISYHDYQGVVVDDDEREKLARDLGVHNKIMILRNHGIIACGETVEEAFHNATNCMTACDAQVRAIPVGLDNITLPSEDVIKKAQKVGLQGGGGVETQGKKWRSGEMEFEALMRQLDNSGYRTGYMYKVPMIKQDKKDRSNSEVEIPPSSSSFTYVFDGDFENSKYVSPLKMAQDRQKKAFKAGWLTSPNAYKKTEVEEIGTTTPKKITRWVSEEGDSPNKPGCVQVRLDHPNQFAPQGENPKELKQKQKSIRKDYYEDKVSAGPQSKVLDGMSWDEAQKAKDGQLSGAGDQVIVVGAASKGIIKRDQQHNAVVYRQYYAANPFENMSETEIENYQDEVQNKEPSQPAESAEPQNEVQEDSNKRQEAQDTAAPEVISPQREYNGIPEVTDSFQGYDKQGQDEVLARLANTLVQTVMHEALAVAQRLGGKGQQILTGNTGHTSAREQCIESLYTLGGQIDNKDEQKLGDRNNFGEETSECSNVKDRSSKQFSTKPSQHAKLPEYRVHGSSKKRSSKPTFFNSSDAPRASIHINEEASKGDTVTIQINPITVQHASQADGMRIKFSVHSTVRRRICAELKQESPIQEVYASATHPTVQLLHSSQGSNVNEPLSFIDEMNKGANQPHTNRNIAVDLNGSCGVSKAAVNSNAVNDVINESVEDKDLKKGEVRNEEADKAVQVCDTKWKLKEKDKSAVPIIKMSLLESPDTMIENEGKFADTDGAVCFERQQGNNMTNDALQYESEDKIVIESKKSGIEEKCPPRPTQLHPGYKKRSKTSKRAKSNKAKKSLAPLSPVREIAYEGTELEMDEIGQILDSVDDSFERLLLTAEDDLLLGDKGGNEDLDLSEFKGIAPLAVEDMVLTFPQKCLPCKENQIPLCSDPGNQNKAFVSEKNPQKNNGSSSQSKAKTDEAEIAPEKKSKTSIDDMTPQKKSGVSIETSIYGMAPQKKSETSIDDMAPQKKSGLSIETSIDDMTPQKKSIVRIDDLTPHKKSGLSINNMDPQKKSGPNINCGIRTETSIGGIPQGKKVTTSLREIELGIDELIHQRTESTVDNYISPRSFQTHTEEIISGQRTETRRNESNVDDIVLSSQIKTGAISSREFDTNVAIVPLPHKDTYTNVESLVPQIKTERDVENIINPRGAESSIIPEGQFETGSDKFIPHNQPNTETNVDDIFPPSQRNTETNVDDIFSPSQRNTETSVDDIFPPSQRNTETNVDDIFPPIQKNTETNVDDIFPPSQRNIETSVDDIFSPSQRNVETNVDDIFSPSQRNTETNIDDIFPPSQRNTETNVDDIFPPSQRNTETNVDDIFPQSQRNTESKVDICPTSQRNTETNVDDIFPPIQRNTETNVDDIFSPSQRNTETNVDDIFPPSQRNTETSVDDIFPPIQRNTETNVDDIFPPSQGNTETNVNDIYTPSQRNTETSVDDIISQNQKKIESSIDDITFQSQRCSVHDGSSHRKTETNIDDLITGSGTETNIYDIAPFQPKMETNLDDESVSSFEVPQSENELSAQNVYQGFETNIDDFISYGETNTNLENRKLDTEISDSPSETGDRINNGPLDEHDEQVAPSRESHNIKCRPTNLKGMKYMLDDSITSEGPIQTSSPKISRAKKKGVDSDFHKNLCASEKTLLDSMPYDRSNKSDSKSQPLLMETTDFLSKDETFLTRSSSFDQDNSLRDTRVSNLLRDNKFEDEIWNVNEPSSPVYHSSKSILDEYHLQKHNELMELSSAKSFLTSSKHQFQGSTSDIMPPLPDTEDVPSISDIEDADLPTRQNKRYRPSHRDRGIVPSLTCHVANGDLRKASPTKSKWVPKSRRAKGSTPLSGSKQDLDKPMSEGAEKRRPYGSNVDNFSIDDPLKEQDRMVKDNSEIVMKKPQHESDISQLNKKNVKDSNKEERKGSDEGKWKGRQSIGSENDNVRVEKSEIGNGDEGNKERRPTSRKGSYRNGDDDMNRETAPKNRKDSYHDYDETSRERRSRHQIEDDGDKESRINKDRRYEYEEKKRERRPRNRNDEYIDDDEKKREKRLRNENDMHDEDKDSEKKRDRRSRNRKDRYDEDDGEKRRERNRKDRYGEDDDNERKRERYRKDRYGEDDDYEKRRSRNKKNRYDEDDDNDERRERNRKDRYGEDDGVEKMRSRKRGDRYGEDDDSDKIRGRRRSKDENCEDKKNEEREQKRRYEGSEKQRGNVKDDPSKGFEDGDSDHNVKYYNREDDRNKDRQNRDVRTRKIGMVSDVPIITHVEEKYPVDSSLKMKRDLGLSAPNLLAEQTTVPSNQGLVLPKGLDPGASPRLARRRGGAIAPNDEKLKKLNNPYRNTRNHLFVPLSATGNNMNRSLRSVHKSSASLASSTLSRRSKSSSRIFENCPELLPPVPQINPLTGEPYNFVHPLMSKSMESLRSRASSRRLYHSPEMDRTNNSCDWDPVSKGTSFDSHTNSQTRIKDSSEGKRNKYVKEREDEFENKEDDTSSEQVERQRDKRRSDNRSDDSHNAVEKKRNKEKEKQKGDSHFKKGNRDINYNDRKTFDGKDRPKQKERRADEYKKTKREHERQEGYEQKESDNEQSRARSLLSDSRDSTMMISERKHDEGHPTLVSETSPMAISEIPRVTKSNSEEDDKPPELPPKKGLFSRLSCVGGKSSAIGKKQSNDKSKVPLEKRAAVDESSSQKEYYAAEKKRMKKLARNKEDEPNAGLYFQDGDNGSNFGKIVDEAVLNDEARHTTDSATSKPFSTFAAHSNNTEGFSGYFEEETGPANRGTHSVPTRSQREMDRRPTVSLKSPYSDEEDSHSTKDRRRNDQSERKESIKVDEQKTSEKKWQPRASRDKVSPLRPRSSKSPENPYPTRHRKDSVDHRDTFNSTMESDVGIFSSSLPVNYSLDSSLSPQITDTSGYQVDPSASFDASELIRYKKHARRESVDMDSSFPTGASPPLKRGEKSPVRRRISQVSLGGMESGLNRTRSSSTSSNPLIYQPWRSQRKQRGRSMSISEMVYAAGAPRPSRSHSVGEITYNDSLLGQLAGRRRSRTNSIGEIAITSRMYHRRRSRSHSRASLGDTSFGSVAPGLQRRQSGTWSSHPAELDVAPAHAAPVKRAESAREPSKNSKLIDELGRKNLERTKSDRQPQIKEELGEDKPVSPSKSDTMKSTDSASGGETLEERSSKEGSPTKEHPTTKDKKGKKKKFRIPSFSKKKNKEAKESAI